MKKRITEITWVLVENLPALLTVAFTTYVLIRSQVTTFQITELLLWLLGIVGLLATSELVERFSRLRRIENASSRTLQLVEALGNPDAEAILQDRSSLQNLPKGAGQAREIWAMGYSMVNLITSCEGFFAARLEAGCRFRFLLLKPDHDAAKMLDAIVTARPGELIDDIRTSLARLDKIRNQVQPAPPGDLQIHLFKVIPTYSLILVDPGTTHGYIHVEPYPSFQGIPLDVGRPHFTLGQAEGRWYRFFYNQFDQIWKNQTYSEPYPI